MATISLMRPFAKQGAWGILYPEKKIALKWNFKSLIKSQMRNRGKILGLGPSDSCLFVT